VRANLDLHLAGKTPVYRDEHRVLCRDGTYTWILDRGLVLDRLPDGRPARVIGTLTDVSVQKRMEERLRLQAEELAEANARLAVSEREHRRLAATDALTGIANRRTVVERGAEELARARRHCVPLAVVMVDVDRFKRVNDTYGHATGDVVLRAVAEACRAKVRTEDCFGRLGGEEFAAILPATDLAGAAAVAEKLRRKLETTPIDLGEGTWLGVTASFGVAELAPGDDMDALIRRADAGLYQAKQAGRNRVVAVPSPARATPSPARLIVAHIRGGVTGAPTARRIVSGHGGDDGRGAGLGGGAMVDLPARGPAPDRARSRWGPRWPIGAARACPGRWPAWATSRPPTGRSTPTASPSTP
jgi:diguanylate cyclase (GGDEF)-like protein